jgi:hypothetical protein
MGANRLDFIGGKTFRRKIGNLNQKPSACIAAAHKASAAAGTFENAGLLWAMAISKATKHSGKIDLVSLLARLLSKESHLTAALTPDYLSAGRAYRSWPFLF